MYPIVTLTMNPTVDTNIETDRVIPDRKIRCDAPQHEAGGGGINVSKALNNLGGSSLAIYPSGGPTGQILRDLMDQAGVVSQRVPIQGWTRENLNVTDRSTQQQYRFIMPGPELLEQEWRECLERVGDLHPPPEYLVLSGSLPPGAPMDFYAQVIREMKPKGTRCILDTSGEPLACALKEGVFLVKPSLRELSELVGKELRTEKEQSLAALSLVQKGEAEYVISSLGHLGAFLASKEGTERHPAVNVPVSSRIGAGDSMVAGIVLTLYRKKPVGVAMRYGMAAGAAAATTSGTQLCSFDETERLAKWLF